MQFFGEQSRDLGCGLGHLLHSRILLANRIKAYVPLRSERCVFVACPSSMYLSLLFRNVTSARAAVSHVCSRNFHRTGSLNITASIYLVSCHAQWRIRATASEIP
uniref:Adrenodoxin-like protein n=1 Tax=Schistocephalus solidus TaxID=70667 RepID=A0A0V0J3H6_SCHSO